jgi:hypothetical protein
MRRNTYAPTTMSSCGHMGSDSILYREYVINKSSSDMIVEQIPYANRSAPRAMFNCVEYTLATLAKHTHAHTVYTILDDDTFVGRMILTIIDADGGADDGQTDDVIDDSHSLEVGTMEPGAVGEDEDGDGDEQQRDLRVVVLCVLEAGQGVVEPTARHVR